MKKLNELNKLIYYNKKMLMELKEKYEQGELTGTDCVDYIRLKDDTAKLHEIFRDLERGIENDS